MLKVPIFVNEITSFLKKQPECKSSTAQEDAVKTAEKLVFPPLA